MLLIAAVYKNLPRGHSGKSHSLLLFGQFDVIYQTACRFEGGKIENIRVYILGFSLDTDDVLSLYTINSS